MNKLSYNPILKGKSAPKYNAEFYKYNTTCYLSVNL